MFGMYRMTRQEMQMTVEDSEVYFEDYAENTSS